MYATISITGRVKWPPNRSVFGVFTHSLPEGDFENSMTSHGVLINSTVFHDHTYAWHIQSSVRRVYDFDWLDGTGRLSAMICRVSIASRFCLPEVSTISAVFLSVFANSSSRLVVLITALVPGANTK